jgi:hypothetical protein
MNEREIIDFAWSELDRIGIDKKQLDFHLLKDKVDFAQIWCDKDEMPIDLSVSMTHTWAENDFDDDVVELYDDVIKMAQRHHSGALLYAILHEIGHCDQYKRFNINEIKSLTKEVKKFKMKYHLGQISEEEAKLEYRKLPLEKDADMFAFRRIKELGLFQN